MKIRHSWCIAIMSMLLGSNVFSQGYTYSDGSANTYKIAPEMLEYIPVRKEHSSSGNYSGGTAKTVKISSDDYSLIRGLLEEAIAQKAAHTALRAKMSGRISRNIESEETEVILRPGAAIKNQIEKKLSEFLNRGAQNEVP